MAYTGELIPCTNALVIDDNEDAASTLTQLLHALGHDAACATSGIDGLSKARRIHPDIIFLDIGMPGMDGFEVLHALRDFPELRDVKIVALIAWNDDVMRRKTRAAGFDMHIGIPASVQQIRDALLDCGRLH